MTDDFCKEFTDDGKRYDEKTGPHSMRIVFPSVAVPVLLCFCPKVTLFRAFSDLSVRLCLLPP